MPADTRRICGPEESHPVILKSDKTKPNSVLNDDGSRMDGRHHDEIRPMFLRTGVVKQAKGSAYIEMNKTKVICAVYGPREAPRKQEFSMKGRLTCEFKFAPFSCIQRRKHIQDSEQKEYSSLIVQALLPAVCIERFPKAQVDIYITVLENDGGALAAGIICASMALADAGTEMYDLVTACSIVHCQSKHVLDPTSMELRAKDTNGCTTVAVLPSLNQISCLVQNGELTVKETSEGIKSGMEGCARMYQAMQQCLLKSTEKKFLVQDDSP